MSLFFSYITNFLPIPLGILAFYVIRSVSISKSKIKIYNREIRINSTRTPPAKEIDKFSNPSREEKLDLVVKDMLIVQGLLDRKNKFEEKFLAFTKFGVIDIASIEKLEIYLRLSKKNRLVLFVSESEIFLSIFEDFGLASGILIAYLMDYKIDVLGGCY